MFSKLDRYAFKNHIVKKNKINENRFINQDVVYFLYIEN